MKFIKVKHKGFNSPYVLYNLQKYGQRGPLVGLTEEQLIFPIQWLFSPILNMNIKIIAIWQIATFRDAIFIEL